MKVLHIVPGTDDVANGMAVVARLLAKELGLTPVYTRQGYEAPCCRNMAIDGVSFQENLGRVLGAWPKVGETL